MSLMFLVLIWESEHKANDKSDAEQDHKNPKQSRTSRMSGVELMRQNLKECYVHKCSSCDTLQYTVDHCGGAIDADRNSDANWRHSGKNCQARKDSNVPHSRD